MLPTDASAAAAAHSKLSIPNKVVVGVVVAVVVI